MGFLDTHTFGFRYPQSYPQKNQARRERQRASARTSLIDESFKIRLFVEFGGLRRDSREVVKVLVLAAPQGFEPRYADPESAVLPLNEGAKRPCRFALRPCGLAPSWGTQDQPISSYGHSQGRSTDQRDRGATRIEAIKPFLRSARIGAHEAACSARARSPFVQVRSTVSTRAVSRISSNLMIV